MASSLIMTLNRCGSDRCPLTQRALGCLAAALCGFAIGCAAHDDLGACCGAPEHDAPAILPSAVRLTQWAQLRPGMSLDDVVSLVGPPDLERLRRDLADPVATHISLEYPAIRFEHPSLPDWSNMTVVLRRADLTVIRVNHPFSEPLSLTDLAAPELLYPRNGGRVDVLPRWIDFRWRPCAWKTAVSYSVELRQCEPGYWVPASSTELDLDRAELVGCWDTSVPYLARRLPGAGSYAWRVGATVDDVTQVKWSAWRMLVADH